MADSFRVKRISHLGEEQIHGALATIREVLEEIDVPDGTPALAS
jgi:hypothetical protein